jgi:hypothetical protein
MAETYSQVIARTEARARIDPDFVELLGRLVDLPTVPAGDMAVAAAGDLSRQRQAEVQREFQAGALPTAAVQDLLGLGTPQAVHRLRSRGRLLALTVGNGTWFPAWQFRDGRIRPDLPRILELLARFSADVLAADRAMRVRRDDLGGISLNEALAQPERAEEAWSALADLSA